MDKRNAILDAAERVFRSKGLAATTTRAITQAAGCAEGTLYLYFKGRAELFVALFERHVVRSFAVFTQLVERVGNEEPERVLLDVGMQFLAFHREVGPMLASLFAEPELLAKYRKLILARSQGEAPRALPALVAYLRAEQKAGRIARDIDCSVTAEALLGTCFARAIHDHMFDDYPEDAANRKFLRKLIAQLIRP